MERLRDFMKVVATNSLEQFLEQFPHPFLFFSEMPGEVEQFAQTRELEKLEAAPSKIDRFSDRLLEFRVLLPSVKASKEFPRKIFIGREKGLDFVVAHDTVSSHHAFLVVDEKSGLYHVVDSGSTNGTVVRGVTLTVGERVPLRDGDLIIFGEVHFLFFTAEGTYRFLYQYRMFQLAMNPRPV